MWSLDQLKVQQPLWLKGFLNFGNDAFLFSMDLWGAVWLPQIGSEGLV